MAVLGIDQSQTATGIYSMTTERGQTVKGEGFKGPARVNRIKRRVVELVTVERPQLVVLEGYDYKSQRAHMAGEVRGVILDALWELGYGDRYRIVPPGALKKFATGNGNAKKPEMKDAIATRYNRVIRDEHQADAFWLAMVGLFLLAPPREWPAMGATLDQVKVLRAVLANPRGEQGGGPAWSGGLGV